VEYSYAPRSAFVPFHNRYQRWAVMVTHRRAGKTVALGNDLIMGMMECPRPRPQFAFIGPTYTQTKRNVWEYLKEYSKPFWDRPPSESDLTITLKNKAKLFVAGSDNPDQLRGMYLDGAVMDEYSLQRPNVFTEVVRPALSDRNGWGVFAGTPKGKNHFYELKNIAHANPHEYYFLELKASQSGIILADELESLRAQMSREEYEQEYECSFESALVGAIWAEEMALLDQEQRARPLEWDPATPVSVVYDLGFTDATVALFWQHHPRSGENRIVHCYATTGADIHTHIDYLHSMPYKYKNVWLPHDAKARNLQTGKSIVEQFVENGIGANMLRVVPSHKLRDGLSAARQVFPSVQIDTSPSAGTETLLEALKSYRREWNIDLKMYMERPVHDWASHYADAFRYLCVVSPKPDKQPLIEESRENAPFSLNNLWMDHAARVKTYSKVRI
jgi:hypothetical protein